jgi:hypothetical protein
LSTVGLLLNRANRDLMERINGKKRIYLTGTMLGEQFAIRICSPLLPDPRRKNGDGDGRHPAGGAGGWLTSSQQDGTLTEKELLNS